MAEFTLENVYPLAGLIVIGVTIWGMAKKFTSMDLTINNDQKNNEQNDALNRRDIEALKEEVKCLRRDVREIGVTLIKLKQQVEDMLSK